MLGPRGELSATLMKCTCFETGGTVPLTRGEEVEELDESGPLGPVGGGPAEGLGDATDGSGAGRMAGRPRRRGIRGRGDTELLTLH